MKDVKLFQSNQIRSIWNDEAGEWFFSVVDVVGALTDSADKSAYWRKLKQRLKAEGSEAVTNCHRLKLQADDGKDAKRPALPAPSSARRVLPARST